MAGSIHVKMRNAYTDLVGIPWGHFVNLGIEERIISKWILEI
jgi:hypothetical protein